MVKVSFKSVENGIILNYNGNVYVFTNAEALGEWMFNRAHVELTPKTVDVVLVSFGEGKQITAIKLIRELTGLGLKDAKDLSDVVRDGGKSTILTGLTLQDGELAKRRMEAADSSIKVRLMAAN